MTAQGKRETRETIRLNRDYALISMSGRVFMESHDRARCEQLGRELLDEGILAEVIASDLPRSRAALTRSRQS